MERAGDRAGRPRRLRSSPAGESWSCAARATTAATGSSRRGCCASAAARSTCCCWATPGELRGDARANLERLPGARAGAVRRVGALEGAAAIVDAILGTGFSGEPREPAAGAIAAINRARRCRRASWSPATCRAASTRRPARSPAPAVRARRHRDLPRRQAGAVDRARQGARGRGPGGRHRDPRRRPGRAADRADLDARGRRDPAPRARVDQVRRRQRARVRRLARADRRAVHGLRGGDAGRARAT